MVVILQKMIMTGAMCVVAQGSSVQLLIAILVMLMYMLLGEFGQECPRIVSVVWFVLKFVWFVLNVVLLSFLLSGSLKNGSF